MLREPWKMLAKILGGEVSKAEAWFSQESPIYLNLPPFLFLSRTPGHRVLAAVCARPPGRESQSLVKDFLREMLTSTEV